MKRKIYFLLLTILSRSPLLAQPNCTQTSVGLTPISDLGTGTYNGWVGGLYPNGSNYMPAVHKAAGLALAATVRPLDMNGILDTAGGKIVWLSIGFSNTTQEASTFIPLANALPNKNPKLQLIDGAVGGQTAQILSTPTDPGYAAYWSTVSSRLATAGVTASQVQVIWFKDDNVAGTTPLQTHYDSLLAQSKRIMKELRTRFPHVKLCYIASRIYAGYASSTLNPEPYAYRNGWAMKKMIEDQINGDPQLQYSGAGANAPWLSWGVYQWADGTTPRSDGLTWVCPADYQSDGTHPSTIGRQKVANLLLQFFQTDSTACSWFLSNCQIGTTGINPVPVEQASIQVYPNPFSREVTIKTERAFRDARVVLYNAFGQQVKRVDGFSGQALVIGRDDLRPGIYFLEISEGGRIVVRRVVAAE